MDQAKDKEKSTTDIDFNKFCRLCLNKSDKLINIFHNNENCSLNLRIMSCAALEVVENDALPKAICMECRYSLEKSYYLRKRSKNTDAKLRRYIKLKNSGKKSDIFDDDYEDEDDEDYTESKEFFKKWEMQQNLKKKNIENDAFESALEEAIKNEKAQIRIELEKEFEEKLQELQEKHIEQMIVERISEEEGPENSLSGKENVGMVDQGDIEEEEEDVEGVDQPEEDKLYVGEDEQEYLDELTENATLIFPTNDDSEEYEGMIEEHDQSNKKEYQAIKNEPSYTIGTSAHETEDVTISLSEFYQHAEYLEENEEDDEEETENTKVSDAIRETIASSIGLDLSDDLKYKVKKREINSTQFEVTTSSGEVLFVELEEPLNDDEQTVKKLFKCGDCPKLFSRDIQLKRHSLMHDKKIGHHCNYCEKFFPSKSSLTRHTRIHTGEKPFKCEECGRSFIQKEILKRHSMVHTGQRPFSCQHCDRTFTQKEILRQHINRQHLEIPIIDLHKCPQCPKSFYHASGLSRHLIIHSGRKFGCSYCPKMFSDKSALKRHLVALHLDSKVKDLN